MMPYSYEQTLLAAQKEKSVGIFACNEYDIFTNSSTSLTDGDAFPFEVSVVAINLWVPLGGKWMTALNTPVLNAVWKDVVKQGKYRNHDWVVKLDPDTVFFPQRLRNLLGRRRPMSLVSVQGPADMYLNNCEFGLHGPIEVLSQ